MRICLCIAEDDLRAWVMEELLLMTWVEEQPTFVITNDLRSIDPSATLVIADAAVARPQAVPVIAIGADPGIPGIYVLPAKLTSRELKLTIRQALPRGPRTAESALG